MKIYLENGIIVGSGGQTVIEAQSENLKISCFGVLCELKRWENGTI